MSRDAELLARAILPLLGTCRICGCHGDECSLEAGERCSWFDKLRTVCTNPRCVMAAGQQQKRHRQDEERSQRNYVPHWLKQKRNGVNKRRRGKTKGRAA